MVGNQLNSILTKETQIIKLLMETQLNRKELSPNILVFASLQCENRFMWRSYFHSNFHCCQDIFSWVNTQDIK